jgi:hypothetical protein
MGITDPLVLLLRVLGHPQCGGGSTETTKAITSAVEMAKTSSSKARPR